MYVEHDATTREIAITFEPYERPAYEWYLGQAARQEPVRSEVPQQTTYEACGKISWASEHLHISLLQSPRQQTRVHQG